MLVAVLNFGILFLGHIRILTHAALFTSRQDSLAGLSSL